MTWTESHRVAGGTGQADWDAFYDYMWDTYLPSKGWEVYNDHPVGSTYKRVIQKLDSWTDGNVCEQRVSVKNQSTNLYYFTNPPADWSDDGTSFIAVDNDRTWEGADFVFWESDQDPDAALITRHVYVMWYWPGSTGKTMLTTEAAENGMSLIPLCEAMGFQPRNVGWVPANESDEPLVLNHTFYGATDANVQAGERHKVIKGFYLYASGATYPDSYSRPFLSIDSSDVLLWMEAGSTQRDRVCKPDYGAGGVWQLGDRYYFVTAVEGDQSATMLFDVGTTEPV